MASFAASSTEAKLLEIITSFDSPPPSYLIHDVKNVPILFYVCYIGSTALFDALRQRSFCNIDVNALNSATHSLKGTSPLWAALSMGHTPVAQSLLDCGADVNVMYDPKVAPSPLILAAQNGLQSSVDFILSYLHTHAPTPDFVRSFLSLRLPSADGATALFKASQNGHASIVRSLLSSGASVNAVTLDDHASPLSIASFKGHLSVVSQLLAHPDIKVGKASEDTRLPPLHAAARGGHADCLSLLLARLESSSGDVDAVADGELTALHVACGSSHGDSAVVTLLLVAGADASKACIGSGLTPLMLACGKGHTAVVSLLLSKSQEREAEGKSSLREARSSKEDGLRTPLLFAVESKAHGVVKLLLQNGAHVHAGVTSLSSTAASSSSAAVVGPFTALHIAAVNNDPEMVSLLLAYGADVERRAEWKRPGTTGKVGAVSARAIANQCDFLECSNLLMEASRRTTPIDTSDKNVVVPDCFKEAAAAMDAMALAGKNEKPPK